MFKNRSKSTPPLLSSVFSHVSNRPKGFHRLFTRSKARSTLTPPAPSLSSLLGEAAADFLGLVGELHLPAEALSFAELPRFVGSVQFCAAEPGRARLEGTQKNRITPQDSQLDLLIKLLASKGCSKAE